MATAKKLPPFMKKTDKPTKGDLPDPKKAAKKAGGKKK